jgi:uncharacterized protein (DUF58 family)
LAQLGALVPAELRELARSQDLDLRRPIAGGRPGRHRSRAAGLGQDFRDHRAYVPGDDPRLLDWRAAARRDALVLRQAEAEQELRLCVLLDAGGGMAYGEGSQRKWDVARTLAAALCWLALRQGDRAGLAIGRERRIERELLRPAGSAARAEAIARALGRTEPHGVAPVAELLGAALVEGPRAALVVLISDLWDLVPPPARPEAGTEVLFDLLARLCTRGRVVMVVQLVHRDELVFPWRDRHVARFEDLAGTRDPVEGPGAQLREGYLERIHAHLHRIERGCEEAGAHLWRHVSDEPLGDGLGRALARLAGGPPAPGAEARP